MWSLNNEEGEDFPTSLVQGTKIVKGAIIAKEVNITNNVDSGMMQTSWVAQIQLLLPSIF